MKKKNKKSCNRFDYGGVLSQQVRNMYLDSSGNGIAGAISTSFNDTQKQANKLARSAYNFNPVASNNDELMDLYGYYPGLNKMSHLNNRELLSLYGKNIANDVTAGYGAAGKWGALGGLFTGAVGSAIQTHNINKDIDATNSYIDILNNRQSAALSNAQDNLSTRQKLGFEAGYFRDGGDINYFNNGGTHEQNPYGGIPQGIAPNNAINVVEEGEVKWEAPDGDYIFSNNQRLNSSDITDNLLPRNLKGRTIAEAAKKVLKESDERPYDYISKNGKDHFLGILRDINESKNQPEQDINSFKKGGKPNTWYQPLLDSWGNQRYPTTWGATNLYRYDETDEPREPRYKFHVGPSGFVITPNIQPEEDNTPTTTQNNGIKLGSSDNLLSGYNSTMSGMSGILGSPYHRYLMNNNPNGNPTNPSAKGSAGTGAPKTKVTGTTTDNVTPQAAAGATAQPEKKYEFGPAFTDPWVTKRSENIVRNALKQEQKRALTPTPQTIKEKPQKYNGKKAPREFDWSKIGDTALALAPMFAAAFDKPNYDYTNEMRNSFRSIDTPYVSSANYMKYTPIDLDYLLNEFNRRSMANAGNIMNLSGGNRATATAGLLANDFDNYIAQGNARLQADLQNMQNYQRVQQHNTGINEFDINSYNTTARFNAEQGMRTRQMAAMMGQQEYDAWKDRTYGNLSQGLTNLQNLKKQGWTDKELQMLVDSGAIARDPRTGKYVISNTSV